MYVLQRLPDDKVSVEDVANGKTVEMEAAVLEAWLTPREWAARQAVA